jgi:hypothetical protein
MRIDIEQPQPTTIVINGRDISIPGLKAQERQAMAGSPMAAMFTELGALFAGSSTALRNHFHVDAAPGEGAIRLTLTPTDQDNDLQGRRVRELLVTAPALRLFRRLNAELEASNAELEASNVELVGRADSGHQGRECALPAAPKQRFCRPGRVKIGT